MPRSFSPRWRRARVTTSTSSPRPRDSAGVYNASRSELLAQLVDAMAPLQPALVESDAAAMVAAVRRRIRQRALVSC